MGRVYLTALLVLMPFVLGAQPAAPKRDPKLDRIRQKMRQSLERVPDYTCLQTIERTNFTEQSRIRAEKQARKGDKGSAYDASMYANASDKIRVEVALVDGKELHSWPGAEEFTSTPLATMVGYGLVSAGDYATHLETLFAADEAGFDYVGEESLQGRNVLRYDYRVPLAKSEYVLRNEGQEAKVAHHGSLWADAESLDLIRLTFEADNIPFRLKVTKATTERSYMRLPIGGSRVVLPQKSRAVMRFSSGIESRSEISYKDCRQFGAQSELSFGEIAEPNDRERQVIEETQIPPGVVLRIRLETRINSEESAVGDPIRGKLKQAVKRGGKTIAPKGAAVTGRIRVLERHTRPQALFMVGLEFLALEFDSKRARFNAKLTEVAPITGMYSVPATGYRPQGGRIAGVFESLGHTRVVSDPRYPGGGMIFMQGQRFKIRPGLNMVWETVRRR